MKVIEKKKIENSSVQEATKDQSLAIANVFLCHTGYPLMSKALNATGRPMAYSCSWPVYVGGLPPNVSAITCLKKGWIKAFPAMKLD